MRHRTRKLAFIFCGIAGVAFIASFTGCEVAKQAVEEAKQAAEAQDISNKLAVLGMAYHSYHDANRVGPSSWDELITFASENGFDANAITEVKDAGYTVVWGKSFKDVTDGLANTKLATPSGSGPVLMFDGTVMR